MRSNELLSIIVPVYNVKDYLSRCINSILCQTYSNFELLLIDDGSTDGSAAICDQFQTIDQRVKVLHKKNRGVSSARNAGLDLSKGAYIGWVDSDDWIDPDMYSTLIFLLLEYKADVAECKYIVENADGQLSSPKTVNEISSGSGYFMLEMYLEELIFGGVATKLYRNYTFDDFRFPEGRIYEDRTMVLFSCVNNFSFVSTPEIKYHYFFREKSITTSSISEQYARQYIFMIQRFLLLANSITDIERKHETIKKILQESVTWYIRIGRELKTKNCKIYLSLLKQSSGINILSLLQSPNIHLKTKLTLLLLHLGLINSYRTFYNVATIFGK